MICAYKMSLFAYFYMPLVGWKLQGSEYNSTAGTYLQSGVSTHIWSHDLKPLSPDIPHAKVYSCVSGPIWYWFLDEMLLGCLYLQTLSPHSVACVGLSLPSVSPPALSCSWLQPLDPLGYSRGGVFKIKSSLMYSVLNFGFKSWTRK